MQDHDGRDRVSLRIVADDIEEMQLVRQIESRGGLIEEQQTRPPNQRQGKADKLTLAAGHRANPTMGEFAKG